jgi:DNA-directed RNA polymerase subunit L
VRAIYPFAIRLGQSFFNGWPLRAVRRGDGLEIVLVDKGKNHIEVLIEDVHGNVLLEPLKERLLADPTVDIATYDSDHPMYGKKRLFVRVKSGKPQNAIKRALKDLTTAYTDLGKTVDKAKPKNG